MLRGEGFGGFSEKLGPRLKRQREAGLTAMGRRYVGVEEEIAHQGELVGRLFGPEAEREFVERALAMEAGPVRALPGPQKRGRGRPRVEGVRPWEAEGVSRRTWERRKKGGG
jgi:hypothetical protein